MRLERDPMTNFNWGACNEWWLGPIGDFGDSLSIDLHDVKGRALSIIHLLDLDR